MPPRFKPTVCARCGGFKIERPDGLPFCGACEAKMMQSFAKIRPDLAKPDLKIHHRAIQGDDEHL